jgi:hypothetical protein
MHLFFDISLLYFKLCWKKNRKIIFPILSMFLRLKSYKRKTRITKKKKKIKEAKILIQEKIDIQKKKKNFQKC